MKPSLIKQGIAAFAVAAFAVGRCHLCYRRTQKGWHLELRGGQQNSILRWSPGNHFRHDSPDSAVLQSADPGEP